jgi:N-formylmaleamate deformylase
MSNWQSGDVQANGLRLHYTRTGGAKPAVVLAHGFSDDGLCWTPVAKALQADYDVIMVDARCHGQSEASEPGYGTFDQAADLGGVIAALGLVRPIVLGHSMGAATTITLAATQPGAVGAILLEDPPAWWVAAQSSDPAANDTWRERMHTRLSELKAKTREQLIADQRIAEPGWSEAELDPWADAKQRVSMRVVSRSLPAEIDWPTLLRQISCPALLITADPDRGGLVSPEAATAMQALVPQLAVARIADAGHSIRRDQFAAYMQVVERFLSEHRQSGA